VLLYSDVKAIIGLSANQRRSCGPPAAAATGSGFKAAAAFNPEVRAYKIPCEDNGSIVLAASPTANQPSP
jgi:hypothetical protein